MSDALEKAFAAAHAPMAVITSNGRFVRVSGALCALLDTTADELCERTVDDITHPVDLAEAAASRRRVVGEGPVVDRGVWRLMRGDGSFVAMHVACSLVDEREGHLLWQLAELPGEPSSTPARGDAFSIARGRRGFERAVHHQLLRCRRYGEQAALVRCSLQDLGRVRADHGDEAADRLLGLVTDAVRGRLRDTDLVGRLGENEIAALLMHAGPEVQRGAADAIRIAAEGERVEVDEGLAGTRASVGVSSLVASGTVGRAFLEAGGGGAPRQPLRLESIDGKVQTLRYVPGLA